MHQVACHPQSVRRACKRSLLQQMLALTSDWKAHSEWQHDLDSRASELDVQSFESGVPAAQQRMYWRGLPSFVCKPILRDQYAFRSNLPANLPACVTNRAV